MSAESAYQCLAPLFCEATALSCRLVLPLRHTVICVSILLDMAPVHSVVTRIQGRPFSKDAPDDEHLERLLLKVTRQYLWKPRDVCAAVALFSPSLTNKFPR